MNYTLEIPNEHIMILADHIRDEFFSALQKVIDKHQINVWFNNGNNCTVIHTHDKSLFDKITNRIENDKERNKLFFKSINEM